MRGNREILCLYPWILKKIMNTLLSGNSREGPYNTWVTSGREKQVKDTEWQQLYNFCFTGAKQKKKAFLKGLLR